MLRQVSSMLQIATNVIRRSLGTVQARYDSAQTTVENQQHWANADYFAAVTANNPFVRRTLRMRSRLEYDNNCYCKGIIDNSTIDTIGPGGPRLQMMTDNPSMNKFVELQWKQWSKAIQLGDKLRLIETARRKDGEGFLREITNPALKKKTDVLLDFVCLESDQIADVYGWNPYLRPNGDDGIVIDQYGNVSSYKVLRVHPGDYRHLMGRMVADDVPAGEVVHWFRRTRAGQLRGIPETTPALPLFSQLRRFTLATLTAAEMAASIAGVLQTGTPPSVYNPSTQQPDKTVPGDKFQLTRGMLLTLPQGWEAKQMAAEHPTTLHEMFVNILLREIARCMDVPFGIATGDFSKYNFSSSRLEWQTYDTRRDTDRDQFSNVVMDHIFAKFLEELGCIYPLVGLFFPQPWRAKHMWHYAGPPVVDPFKDAKADETNLANNTDTLASIYAERGQDWKEQIDQRAIEIAYCKSKGVETVAISNDKTQNQESDQESQTPENANAA